MALDAFVLSTGTEVDDWLVFIQYISPAGYIFEVHDKNGLIGVSTFAAYGIGDLPYYGGGFFQASPRAGLGVNEFAYSGLIGVPPSTVLEPVPGIGNNTIVTTERLACWLYLEPVLQANRGTSVVKTFTNGNIVRTYNVDVQVTPNISIPYDKQFAEQPSPILCGIEGALYVPSYNEQGEVEVFYVSEPDPPQFIQIGFPSVYPFPSFSSLVRSVIYDSNPYIQDFIDEAASTQVREADTYNYLTQDAGTVTGEVYPFGDPQAITIKSISYFPPNA